MSSREYLIGPEFNLQSVIAKANKLATRAQAKGLSGGYTITIESRDKVTAEGVERGQYLIIEGEPIKYDGWQFVAKVEYVNSQAVITGSPWYEGPQVDRSALKPNACDHCGINIYRKYSIVVENEAGERKQVGSSCVKDFLGQEVNGAWYSDKDPFEALDGYVGSGSVALENIAYTLAQAACVIRQSGFVPAWKREYKKPTADDVRLLKGMGSAIGVAEARKQYGKPTDEDFATAARALEFGKTIEGDSDYAANVRAIFSSDYADSKYIGLIVSVAGVLLKEEGKQQEAEAEPVTEALYAEPKTKIEISGATIQRIIPVQTVYGSSEIIVLTGAGYRFKWFTSAAPASLEVGSVIDFKATVKGEDIWNGEVSTSVVRLKVVA